VLLKFHGYDQQDDRQVRQHRGEPREKAYSFMIRVAIPGGVLSPDQYLELDALADRYANGTVRLTTRQGIQYHGIILGNLKATSADINHSLITTLSVCGDVQRNGMACPARGASHAAIDVSLALGMAAGHAEDPKFVERYGRHFALDAPLGVDTALSDIAATLAIRSWSRATAQPRANVSRDSGGRAQQGRRSDVRVRTVELVGVGPGAADLITVRGQRLLERADVIVHDRLVSPEMLALAKPDALLVDVGKLPHAPQSSQSAINAQLVAFALQDKRVVLMGRSRLAMVRAQLIDAGGSADTPVACIERATLPEQRVVFGTLATIAANANAAGLESPM